MEGALLHSHNQKQICVGAKINIVRSFKQHGRRTVGGGRGHEKGNESGGELHGWCQVQTIVVRVWKERITGSKAKDKPTKDRGSK